MTRISMDSVSENELANRYEELVNKDTWNDICKNCRMPALLHNGVCTWQNEVEASEYEKILDERDKFCERMKGIIRCVEKRKVARINIDSMNNNELARLYEELEDKEIRMEACKSCRMPALLHVEVCKQHNETLDYGKLLD